MHCSHKKKREGTERVTTLWVFFFPWTRETKEEEDFFSSSVSAIFPFQKDANFPLKRCRLTHNFPHVGGAAAQWPPCPFSPLFFSYKNRGAQEKERPK